MSNTLGMSDDPYQRKVLLSAPRKFDLDVHVSRVEVDGVEYYDIREYIPSLRQYGRGILVPRKLAVDVVAALMEDFEASDGD